MGLDQRAKMLQVWQQSTGADMLDLDVALCK